MTEKNNPKKTFVIDTNVVLHDSNCITQFGMHDIVIPITVLEELDNFKKGTGALNYQAREFLRSLDALSGDKIFNGGIAIGENSGKIKIALERPFHPEIKNNFSEGKHDHKILNTVFHLGREKNSGQCILVTKDVNLRMKAKSVGILAEDYTSDHVKNLSSLFRGYRFVEGVSSESIDTLYQRKEGVPIGLLPMIEEPVNNEFFILKNGKKSALSRYKRLDDSLSRVEKRNAYGIVPRNAEQTFALDALMDPDVKLMTISGKAGTGKTLITLAAALSVRNMYRQIYLARPVVPLSNKDIGYLPGDIESKIDPYMQPLFDNLAVIRNQFDQADNNSKKLQEMLAQNKLIISALTYIRGRSLNRVFFIVDEAQNLTPHEVKTIITRAGEGTKIVLTGDIFQIDHPYLDAQSNGLSYCIERMQGQALYAHVNLEKGERSELAELATNLL